MKDFNRSNPLFSLCGLNCGLCPMRLDGYCPGCGGGKGNQPCATARCSLRHGGIEYCFQCPAYPCETYDSLDEYDSFITHRNRQRDLAKAQETGIDSYQLELEEKIEILKYLLANYNDGRRKTFFCVAVNLLELDDIKTVMSQLAEKTEPLPLKERAAYAVRLFQSAAEPRGIVLKLRREARKSKG